MKRQSIAQILVTIFCVSIFTPASAIADQKNKNQSPAPDSSVASKLVVDKFQEDFKIFQDAMKNYEAQRRVINKNFKVLIEKAHADTKALAAPGQSQLQRRKGFVAKQSAIMAAIVLRDAAIEALGPAPIAPTPPAKTPRPDKNKKQSPSPIEPDQ